MFYDSCSLLKTRGSSEHNLTLSVLFLSEDESLASLQDSVSFGLGLSAFELQHDLLGVLCLLSEDRFGLSSETLLLSSVSSFTLGKFSDLSFFVLRDLVVCMLLGLLAVSSNRLWDMHHYANSRLTNKLNNIF